MMYKNIECPTCGNVIKVKSVSYPQSCDWCRRKFKVTITGRGKKMKWSAESLEFTDSNR